MQQATVTFTDPTGLHARPAAVLVQTAGRYQAVINLYLEGSDRFARRLRAGSRGEQKRPPTAAATASP